VSEIKSVKLLPPALPAVTLPATESAVVLFLSITLDTRTSNGLTTQDLNDAPTGSLWSGRHGYLPLGPPGGRHVDK